MRGSLGTLTATAIIGLLINTLSAQTSPATAQLVTGPAYTSPDGKAGPEFPNIDLIFQLRNHDGSPITAHPGDLQLFSLGQQIGTCIGIRPFDRTGYGITTLLLIDAGNSMQGTSPEAIHTAAAKFVAQARPQDKLAVLTMADRAHLEIPFGASQPITTQALGNLQARGGPTHLYDSLLDALALFNGNLPKRRQLLLISSGQDEGSQHAPDEVLLRAISLGVAINSINLAPDQPADLPVLQALSLQTGGFYLQAQSPEAVGGLIDAYIAATRTTPVAAFSLDHVIADGQLLPAKLHWQPGKLSAYAIVQTPKSSLSIFASNPWLVALISCFFVGMVLLALSFRRSPSRHELLPGRESPPSYSNANIKAEIEPRNPQFSAFFDAPSNGPFARLTIRDGTLIGQSFPVTSASFSIGALPGNQLVLPDDLTISGRHFTLHWENSVLSIEDSNSTNGTWLNRHRIPAGHHPLKPGDEIAIGHTLLVVERA